jgi:hypothetical protein
MKQANQPTNQCLHYADNTLRFKEEREEKVEDEDKEEE